MSSFLNLIVSIVNLLEIDYKKWIRCHHSLKLMLNRHLQNYNEATHFWKNIYRVVDIS